MAPSSSNAPDAQISQPTALAYWSGVPPTVNGMLGGYPHISRTDLRGSLLFLNKLRKTSPNYSVSKDLPRAVDCGAGIGRVTAGFLGKVSAVVDVVEPVKAFAGQLRRLGQGEDDDGFGNGDGNDGGDKDEESAKMRLHGACKLGHVYVCGLEAWEPTEQYDLVWVQWCLGYLRDAQAVEFLQRCKGKLKCGGWIVVKENMSTDSAGRDVFDAQDSSVTRTDRSFRGIFEEAGLKILKTEAQRGFPRELYPVRTYALQPSG
ncbi:MAG: hypothetical protein LQ340_001483 [Diploschistes diacapsis]|nr:MAG: hypothetical protein LQ340_001483 [Diploschistes diacapsis]